MIKHSNFSNSHPHHKEEMIERIRNLAAQGLRSQAIANLQGISKNSVIGICHRNNIQLLTKPGPAKGYQPKSPPPKPKPRKIKQQSSSMRLEPEHTKPKHKNLFVRVRPRQIDDQPTEVEEKFLEEHPRRRRLAPTCMWFNCQEPTEAGKPYCSTHTKMSKHI